MQFIADNMLGKLAKWLRFLGYDVLYPKDLTDKELILLSRAEDRYLLTRDKELANTKDLKVLLIASIDLDEQFKQVMKTFNLTLGELQFTRCPECNHILNEEAKSELTNTKKIPKGVLERHNSIWICNNCKRYYWRGSHYEKIKAKLKELSEIHSNNEPT